MEFKKHIHYDLEIEAAVLGICLLERNAFGRTHGIIDGQVFYHSGHQIVYDAIQWHYKSGLPIDLLTIRHRLMTTGHELILSDNCSFFLTQLTNWVTQDSHLEYHCFLLKQMWMEREILKFTHGGAKLEGDIRQQLYMMQQEIQRIKGGDYKKEWYDMSELMVGLISHQERIACGEQVFIETGIHELDKTNGGFIGGQVIVLGARPSAGKTAFAAQLSINMARKGKKVGFVSLEMSNNQIAGRLASIDTEIDFQTIYRNLYKDEAEKERFYNRLAAKTHDLPIFVSDATRVNAMDIRSKADKLKATKGCDILIIDYLQLITGDQSGNKSRENVVSEISRNCKIMAKELDIPVVELCQLNRASTHRSGESRYPNLSDLRESGSLEQDADVVMFIHRDWAVGITVDEKGESTENKADIIVRKWRDGESNMHLPVGFDGPRMMFKFNQQQAQQKILLAPEKINLGGWKKVDLSTDDEAPF